MNRTLVVSDIHGYTDCLHQLLASAHYVPGCDQLLLLGDYVNKGPDSKGALRLAKTLAEAGAIVLKGNNEDKLLRRHAADPGAMPWLDDELLRFTRELPLWHEDDHHIYVHAGIRPGIALTSQAPTDLLSIRNVFYNAPAVSDKLVVFGHTATHVLGAPAGHIWEAPGKLGIDTGAGHQLKLSLVDLTGGLVYACDVCSGRLSSYSLAGWRNQAQ
ncbi:metallophosphoesterase [Paenibacillus daejeonensis]|uniref:metallophosphoesterase n=1 Tax=Paenibacillus daejeonensis TaxID=135193 RepID=UPI00037481AE|nr:metallophosphoesterase [Paenibacillus daejeonensis]